MHFSLHAPCWQLENVLIASDGTFKLCDFGSSQQRTFVCRSEADRAEAAGVIEKNTTPSYRAPEMVDLFHQNTDGIGITTKSDVWALGVLLYQLMFQAEPFPGGNLAILAGKYEVLPGDYSKDLLSLLGSMLQTLPSARPSTKEVLAHLQALGARVATSASPPLLTRSVSLPRSEP